VPAAIRDTVLIAPFNDTETARDIILDLQGELAAVIVEPLQRTIPPRPGFLPGLRELTQRHGIVLVFDEVVTGFRLAYGGAQRHYGVVPDLCALGKSISAGHPLGIVCGRAEIMAQADPARIGTSTYVAQTGTYSANPVSAAAALASLAELAREGAYERLFATGRCLMEALRHLLAGAEIPAQVTGEPPAFEVWFTDREIDDFRATLAADHGLHDRFTALLLERGILKAHEKFFVSLAHTEEDVRATIEAFAGAIETLRAAPRGARNPART
jgi:glutamate-1-semialdehyde 2,1-aminomutase